MKDKRLFVQFVSLVFASVSLLLANLSCSQYDYSTPLPGLVDIRLHTISDPNSIAFDPHNSFVLKVQTIRVVRSDLAQADVFADLKAIHFTAGFYNTVDPSAGDSALVIGQAYLPPGDYIGLLLQINPGSSVLLDGYRNIPVLTPEKFDIGVPVSGQFHISEQRFTHVILTINLDSALTKGSDKYIYSPNYYSISSVQYE